MAAKVPSLTLGDEDRVNRLDREHRRLTWALEVQTCRRCSKGRCKRAVQVPKSCEPGEAKARIKFNACNSNVHCVYAGYLQMREQERAVQGRESAVSQRNGLELLKRESSLAHIVPLQALLFSLEMWEKRFLQRLG